MKSKKLPNFLIVGAAKCGTSSLHNYLNQHSEVFMPTYNKEGKKVKEPRFLIKDLVQHRLHYGVWTWEEYQALFEDVQQEKAIGESTVLYLYYHQSAIPNIKKYLGEDVKIIIMLRNPVDRAYSAYQHVSRGFKENLSFAESLAIEHGRMEREPNLTSMVMYQEMGLYYNMVKAYQENFKEVKVILYEDFTNNTEQVLKETFAFLGINTAENVDFETKHNVGGKRWKNNTIKKVFRKDSAIKAMIKGLIPKKLRKKVRQDLVSVSTEKVTPMDAEIRKKLNAFFKEDVQKLSQLINRDLTYWTE